MALTTRPPAGARGRGARPTQHIGARSQPLPDKRRRLDLVRSAATAAGLGMLGWGALPVLGQPELAPAALSGGLAAAAGIAALGPRSARRAELLDDVAAAMAVHAGPVQLRARRWGGGWVGSPGELVVRYRPEVDDTAVGWSGEMAAAAARRLGSDVGWRVVQQDQRRRRLVLQPAPVVVETDQTRLASRADRLVGELLGPTASVSCGWGDDETGGERLVRVEVEHQAGVRVATGAQRARVDRVVSTMLPGRWRSQWDLVGDSVAFELRPELPRRVDRPGGPIPDHLRLVLPYAQDEDGNDQGWNLGRDAVEPHALVVGSTGSGKTRAMLRLILEACRRGWEVVIVDPKRVEFMALREWPNVTFVATEVEEMVAAIYRHHALMEERYALVESGQARESDFTPVILVLDEFRNFLRQVTAWYAATKVRGMPSKCPILELIPAIAEKGRTAHVHLLVGTQRPDAAFMGEGMRDNFRARLSMGRLSPQGAMMMWDSPQVGVSLPRGMPGRAIALDREDRPSEIQTFWTPDPRSVDDEDDRVLLESLRPASVTHERLVLVPPVRDDLDGTEAGLTYDDWIGAEFVPASVRPDLMRGAGLAGGRGSSRRAGGALRKDLVGARPAGAGEGDGTDAGIDAGTEEAVGAGVEVLEQGLPSFVEGYGDAVTEQVAALVAGDLLLVDPTERAWAVVEACEMDVLEDGIWCVDWRDDEGQIGSLSLQDGEVVTIRRPAEDAPGASAACHRDIDDPYTDPFGADPTGRADRTDTGVEDQV